MEMDAIIAVETFGSPQARQLLGQWSEAATDEDEQRMRSVHDAMVDLARHERGRSFPALPMDSDL